MRISEADFDCKIHVFDKRMNKIAIFDGNTEGYDPEAMRNILVQPVVHTEINGESTFSFQMIATSEKWAQVKDPENIWLVNGRYYTALNDNSYKYEGSGNARVVSVTLVETFYLLSKKYKQVYNCGLNCYAKATFLGWEPNGARFQILSTGCTNPGDSISPELAWHQVRLWQPKDKNGNDISYAIITSKGNAPTGWKDAPAAVAMSSFSVSGNTATVVIRARASIERQQRYEYTEKNSYQVESRPYPPSIKEVYVNTTITTQEGTIRRIVTSNKKSSFNYNSGTGTFSINYVAASNEKINSVIGVYDFYDIGEISNGATCTLAYGAEVVDDHTIKLLPKADKKYKLTIDGVEYEDSAVVDSRGATMPRGSGGYALWSLLMGTGWSLGVCDVLAIGFDTNADYGCFNIESDMKDVLYNIQYVQELYGGILDWDSKNKMVHYRAENDGDYQAYNDGFNRWTGFQFRIGKNMTDQPDITVDNSLITKAYLLGYGNLNVKKVNGGKSYIEDYSFTRDVYEGYIEQPLIHDTNDEGGQRQLLYWGWKELRKKATPRKTIEAKVTDTRTAEGYEHEAFNLGDIVEVYYKDDGTGKEVSEELRIIMWEYNVFALWDCTIQLGDRTRNLIDIFRQIYNASIENAPKLNASGQISSEEIVTEIDVGSIEVYDPDDPNYPYNPYYPPGGGGGGYGIQNIQEYISLIARKVTENSEAIAGLIIQATDLYSQVDLFAEYHKQTEQMIADTYAGLKLYADEQISSLSLTVQGNYDNLNSNIARVGDDLYWFKIESKAGFEAQQTINESTSRQFSQYSSDIRNIRTGLDVVNNSLAEFKTTTNNNFAQTVNQSLFNTTVRNLEGKITAQSNALAQFKTEASSTYAKTTQLAEYATRDYVTGAIKTSRASIEAEAKKNYASVTIEAAVNDLSSVIKATNYSAWIQSTSGQSKGYVGVGVAGYVTITASANISLSANGGNLTLYSNSGIYVGTSSGQAVYIKGKKVAWRSTYVRNRRGDGEIKLDYLGY